MITLLVFDELFTLPVGLSTGPTMWVGLSLTDAKPRYDGKLDAR
jgi:hypothetical protein